MTEFKFQITGLNEVTAKFKKVNDFLTSTKPMQALCDDIKGGILEKTDKGHDYMGRKFKPYSKAYEKKKGQSKVDLKVTGKMLDAMTAKALSNKLGEITINAATEGIIAYTHNTGTSNAGRKHNVKIPQREFMNVTEGGVDVLVKKNFDDPLMVILGRR